MKMSKVFKISFLLISIGFYVQGQQALSLSDAIAKALENNYSIKISNSEQQVAVIQNSWGAAGRYPYISLEFEDDNKLYLNEDENYVSNSLYPGAYVSWTLFEGFAVRINKQRFEELEKLSKQNTAIMVEGTVQSVILAYYNVLLQKEELKVYQEVMSLSEDRYDQAKVKKELGAAVSYDVLQSQNAYLTDRSAFLVQQVNYKNALRDLNFLMAEKEMSYELTDDFKALPVDYSMDDLQNRMAENNKGLQNQYLNQKLLENSVALAKSSYAPTLDFSGGVYGKTTRYDYVNSGEIWDKSATFYGNFTLSYNLFSGGSRRRALQIARVQEESGMVEIDQMKHELNNSLSNLYEFYMVRKELLKVADENLDAAKLNLQISKDKFESGAINSFNYRDVQNIYLNASQQKLEAIYNFIDTHTSLLRMVGVIVQEYE
jgi:outer membrane protein TolC